MGMADIVPGVSGGTVALVLGIYRSLIENIRGGANAMKLVLTGDVSGGIAAFKAIDWWFIVPLLGGIATAFLLLRHTMETLLLERAEGVAAVFTGLVLASSVLVWRALTKDATRIGVLVVVTLLAFWLLGYQSGSVRNPSLIVFFLTGAIAICAMILPGISGSFIMLMLGMYAAVLGGEILELGVFALGAVIGLALFSSILAWLLAQYDQTVMAVLLGLMVGSIRVLWPWPNGVGIISDEADAVITGTELGWPGIGAFVGGVALAAVAAAVTLVIVRFAEADADEQEEAESTRV